MSRQQNSALLNLLDTLRDQTKDAFIALSSCLCQQSARLKINGRTYNILKVLGEGGFSFVYLAQDIDSKRQFALKKIRCPEGGDSVKEAMREVEAYRKFKHKNIIRILDSAVLQDPEGDGQIVYLFLPLYSRGNLQDRINANVINGTQFSEKEMLHLFKGTCEALRAMHTYTPLAVGAASSSSQTNANSRHVQAEHEHAGEEDRLVPQNHDEEDEEDDARFPQAHGDEDGGYSYDGAPSVPAAIKMKVKRRSTKDQQTYSGEAALAHSNLKAGEMVPYAHRDLKPGNVMISDDGQAILMDFGSTVVARVPVETRSQALRQQDIAAEQSTMAYRAPELFDVKPSPTRISEAVDIWSLGCLLYALAYSHSPFENTQTTEQGGSIAMAVLNAKYVHPPGGKGYSSGIRDLIDMCLVSEPERRHNIHQVLEKVDKALDAL